MTTETMRGWARRVWTVALSAGTVAALVVAFQWHGYEPGPSNRFDGWLLFALGVAYAFAAIEMLARNESWPVQAHGQLMTYVGDGVLWWAVGMSRLGWREPITNVELTLVRSCFVVGATCLIVGLVWLEVSLWATRRRTGDGA